MFTTMTGKLIFCFADCLLELTNANFPVFNQQIFKITSTVFGILTYNNNYNYYVNGQSISNIVA